MGEDFPVEVCPKCGSKDVESQWNEITGVRTYFLCASCGYLEVINEDPKSDAPSDEGNPWQQDPDFWKQDEIPD